MDSSRKYLANKYGTFFVAVLNTGISVRVYEPIEMLLLVSLLKINKTFIMISWTEVWENLWLVDLNFVPNPDNWIGTITYWQSYSRHFVSATQTTTQFCSQSMVTGFLFRNNTLMASRLGSCCKPSLLWFSVKNMNFFCSQREDNCFPNLTFQCNISKKLSAHKIFCNINCFTKYFHHRIYLEK